MRVHLDQVGKTYATTGEILRGIDLRAEPGEFIALLGPSGCGKSTLLRLIAGLDSPTSGAIRLDGAATDDRRRTMSVVFQDPRLLPWRHAEANVRLPLELLGLIDGSTHDQLHAALDMVGLQRYRHTYPGELSGGMKMRLSLARALITSPELLLLDEPFSALDEITRQGLNDELLKLWLARGWTGLFVTHNVWEAVYLSQRIVVMGRHPGRICHECRVPFDYPRQPILRTRPEFGAIVATLMEQLEKVSR